jgi:hypothetical protein
MHVPIENGNMDARFCPAAAQGDLPKFAIIMKLFPMAFNVIEQTNHNKFTGIFFIMASILRYSLSIIEIENYKRKQLGI